MVPAPCGHLPPQLSATRKQLWCWHAYPSLFLQVLTHMGCGIQKEMGNQYIIGRSGSRSESFQVLSVSDKRVEEDEPLHVENN